MSSREEGCTCHGATNFWCPIHGGATEEDANEIRRIQLKEQAPENRMESIVSATADGGLIISWEKGTREAAIVLPKDRAVMYYSAYENGERVSAGCVSEHEAVDNMWRWVEGDPWCATGLVEGMQK